MNKRQHKKMFTRAFSRAYDESLKRQKEKQQATITTIRNRRGEVYIITSITSRVEMTKNWTDSPEEITIEGYMLDNKILE